MLLMSIKRTYTGLFCHLGLGARLFLVVTLGGSEDSDRAMDKKVAELAEAFF